MLYQHESYHIYRLMAFNHNFNTNILITSIVEHKIQKTKNWMNLKPLSEYLYTFCTSHQYNQPIRTNNTFSYSSIQVKYEYQPLLNTTEVYPPSIQFLVDKASCSSIIQHDIEKSRFSKQGFLLSNGKGNILNKIRTQNHEEDVGVIQNSENCLVVCYSVIKQNSDDCARQIGVELRSCLNRKFDIFATDEGTFRYQFDEITKQIYQNYRLFMIFECKSQSEKVLLTNACFFPNIKFSIQKIKTKQNIKFSPNDVLNQIKLIKNEDRNKNSRVKGINNSYGFIGFDSKKRIMLLKKDDPQLSKEIFAGVWVVGQYPEKANKKQFGKQDAIWQALFDFYTNQQTIKKTSIIGQNKGLLCYFATNNQNLKQNFKLQLYLFSNDSKSPCKWSFITKSQYVSDWSKPLEVKFDFLSSAIMEERQYSQFSDQTYNEESRSKNENINRQNVQSNPMNMKLSQTKKSREQDNQKPEFSQKDIQIMKLKQELEMYKKRCIELETMNKMLMQEKMMNQMMYMSPQMPQPYNYPAYQLQNSQSINPLAYSQMSNPQESIPRGKVNQSPPSSPRRTFENVNFQHSSPPKFAFKQESKDIITFSQQIQDNDEEELPEPQSPENKAFVKKKSEETIKKQSDKLKANSETIREIFVRHDAKNISFQDSFVEYHSDEEKTVNQKDERCDVADQQECLKSPQFKRYVSEEVQSHQKNMRDSKGSPKNDNKFTEISNKQLGSKEKEKEKQAQKEKREKKIYKNDTNAILRKYKVDQDSEKGSSNQKPVKKKKKVLVKYSQSEDSDEDIKIKNIRNKYLRK